MIGTAIGWRPVYGVVDGSSREAASGLAAKGVDRGSLIGFDTQRWFDIDRMFNLGIPQPAGHSHSAILLIQRLRRS